MSEKKKVGRPAKVEGRKQKVEIFVSRNAFEHLGRTGCKKISEMAVEQEYLNKISLENVN